MDAGKEERAASPHEGSIIETLARETGSEPARVRELYERELAHLESTAKIKGFIPLLASRHVRRVLRDSNAGA
jgi:hypothetical protein